VWEGEGVIKYGRKLIGATDPQKSEPGTIRGDLAVVVGRYAFIFFSTHSLVLHFFDSVMQAYYKLGFLCTLMPPLEHQKHHSWK